ENWSQVGEKIWPDTMDIARHIIGIGVQPQKDWVNSKGLNFVELLLIQTMEPGNKVYKTLTEILEKEAVKVD
ncbi:MAG: hypothetical protein PVI66_12725, partial [Candidatus Aminicenantes bacterium]